MFAYTILFVHVVLTRTLHLEGVMWLAPLNTYMVLLSARLLTTRLAPLHTVHGAYPLDL